MRKIKRPPLTSLQFFAKLKWLDGTPLQIEPYRQRIFGEVLDRYNDDGSPVYSQALLGRGKKNNKSLDLTLATMYCVLFRKAVQGNAGIIVASSEDQAADDLELARKLIEVNADTLGREFQVLAKELKLRDGSGSIRVLPVGDASSLHGKQYSVLSVDELHTQADWRLLEALAPDPTRQPLVWITSYDSVTDEEGQPLHDLKQTCMANADPTTFFSWYSGEYCNDPLFADLPPEERANPSMSSWVNENYLEQERARLPANIYRRLHLNLPSTSAGFIDMDQWDQIVDPDWREQLHNKALRVYVGIDAGHKHDSTAVVCVCLDRATQQVKLVFHRTFVPRKGEPLDFASTIGETLHIIKQRYTLVKVLFDPWQMQHLAQELKRERMPIEEYPQSVPNLAAMSENLRQLITSRNLVIYPDKQMRLSASRATAVEMPGRGAWRLAKERASHKIDVIVALAMACHACVNKQEPVGICQLLGELENKAHGSPAPTRSPQHGNETRAELAVRLGDLPGYGGGYYGGTQSDTAGTPFWPRGT